jgi:hypothetical protein
MLMSIAILHILPEANEMYHGVLEKEGKAEKIRDLMRAQNNKGKEEAEEHEEEGGHSFPLPFVIFQAGFFLMLTVNTVF